MLEALYYLTVFVKFSAKRILKKYFDDLLKIKRLCNPLRKIIFSTSKVTTRVIIRHFNKKNSLFENKIV